MGAVARAASFSAGSLVFLAPANNAWIASSPPYLQNPKLLYIGFLKTHSNGHAQLAAATGSRHRRLRCKCSTSVMM